MKLKSKLLAFVAVLTLCSCQSKTGTMRIVNSEGEPVRVKRSTPNFNSEQLKKQKKFKDRNGGISLIDESGRRTFDSRGNNYAYAEKRNESTLFEDKERGSGKKIVKIVKTKDKATIVNKNGKEDVVGSKNVNININKYNVEEKDGVQYFFSEENTSAKARKRKEAVASSAVALNKYDKKSSRSSASASSAGRYYLQLGAFKSKTNANNMLREYTNISSGEIKTVNINGKKVYRVVLGPYGTKGAAEVNKKKVIQSGHYDVFITKR